MKKLLLLIFLSTGCSVYYRHEIEDPGTEVNWKYSESEFVRYDGYEIGDKSVAGDLEVAVVDYTHKEYDTTVKLVGVIHLADRSYYKQLQTILNMSDLVLYEGVSKNPREHLVDLQTREMWDIMSSLIGLDGQVSVIDYDNEHFKQCDLITDVVGADQSSLMQFDRDIMDVLRQLCEAKSEAKKMMPNDGIQRVEDYVKHNMALSLISTKGAPTDGVLDMIREVKTAIEPLKDVNQEVSDLYVKLESLEEHFKSLGKLIIDDRNKYVINVLSSELRNGNRKNISIFYGAGHNADFDRRLRRLGFDRGKTHWFKAWEMNSR